MSGRRERSGSGLLPGWLHDVTRAEGKNTMLYQTLVFGA